MALLSDRQQRNLLIALGLTDFATRSRLSTAAFDLIIATAKRAGPPAGRAAVGVIPRAVGTARFIAMRHPYVTAAVVTYEVVKHRDQIRQLLSEGWEIVEPGVSAAREVVDPVFEQAAQIAATAYPTGPGISARTLVGERFFPKAVRKPSTFNKAIKAGMQAVKKSTSYGKKGTISPATKAFALVTKLASAKKKKKKAPKSGIRRIIWNAMKGLR